MKKNHFLQITCPDAGINVMEDEADAGAPQPSTSRAAGAVSTVTSKSSGSLNGLLERAQKKKKTKKVPEPDAFEALDAGTSEHDGPVLNENSFSIQTELPGEEVLRSVSSLPEAPIEPPVPQATIVVQTENVNDLVINDNNGPDPIPVLVTCEASIQTDKEKEGEKEKEMSSKQFKNLKRKKQLELLDQQVSFFKFC